MSAAAGSVLLTQSGRAQADPQKVSPFHELSRFLGHVVNSKGVSTDPGKVKGVHEFSLSAFVPWQMSPYLSCGFFKHCLSLHCLASPLTQKELVHVWMQEHDNVFHQLKEILSQPALQAYSTVADTFVLDKNSSSIGMWALLSQKLEEAEFFIDTLTWSGRG